MKLAEKNANDAREATLAMQKVVIATKRLDAAIREATTLGLDIYLNFSDGYEDNDNLFNFYRANQCLGVSSSEWGPELPEFINAAEPVGEYDEHE